MKKNYLLNYPAEVGTVFDKADIAQANWFHVQTGEYQYPQPEDGYLRATFNLDSYCNNCGIGKLQNAILEASASGILSQVENFLH